MLPCAGLRAMSRPVAQTFIAGGHIRTFMAAPIMATAPPRQVLPQVPLSAQQRQRRTTRITRNPITKPLVDRHTRWIRLIAQTRIEHCSSIELSHDHGDGGAAVASSK